MIINNKNKSIPSSKSVDTYLDNEKVIFSKYMVLLSSILFAFFGLVDLSYLSTNIETAHMIRGATIGYLFVVFFIPIIDSKFFLNHYFGIMFLSFMVCSLSIQSIINISSSNDLAQSIYFAGLMLIVMSLFAWTFLKTLESIFITSIIISMYILSAYHYSSKSFIEVLFHNLGTILFLFSSAVIGLMSSLMRNKYLSYATALQTQLRAALKVQKEEADLHKELALTDELTGLPNRRGAMELLNKKFSEAEKNNDVVVVSFLDLNEFKVVNDTYGHKVGDEVLTITSSRITNTLRKTDLLSRLSGDEFLIAVTISNSKLELINLMFANIKRNINKPMRTSKGLINQSISLGCAVYPHNGNTVDAVIEVADKRMYKDKYASKNEGESIPNFYDVNEEISKVNFK